MSKFEFENILCPAKLTRIYQLEATQSKVDQWGRFLLHFFLFSFFNWLDGDEQTNKEGEKHIGAIINFLRQKGRSEFWFLHKSRLETQTMT